MDNPYEPPSSRVVDVGPARGAKPPAVYRAVRMLWVSFAIDMISLLPGVRQGLWDDSEVPLWLNLAFTGVLGALGAALIVAVSRGRNWARWLLAALYTLGWALTFLTFDEFVAQGALGVALDGVTLAMEICAFVLLFSRTSTAWFRLPE